MLHTWRKPSKISRKSVKRKIDWVVQQSFFVALTYYYYNENVSGTFFGCDVLGISWFFHCINKVAITLVVLKIMWIKMGLKSEPLFSYEYPRHIDKTNNAGQCVGVWIIENTAELIIIDFHAFPVNDRIIVWNIPRNNISSKTGAMIVTTPKIKTRTSNCECSVKSSSSLCCSSWKFSPNISLPA